jgi:aspartokinase
MISISQALQEILDKDYEVVVALRRNILNFSSYAREIKKDVEKLCMKEINTRSLIVALSRYQKKLKGILKNNSPIEIINLSVHTNLEELVYENTRENKKKIWQSYEKLSLDNKSYLVFTNGISEITIIGDQSLVSKFEKKLNIKPFFYKKDLIGITVKFTKENINIPNILFRLSRRLAVKNINIIEYISTFTEITFIVERKNADLAIRQLTTRQF